MTCMVRHLLLMSFAVCAVLAVAAPAAAEKGDGVIEAGENESEDLARAAQNPVADLISLTFQNNTYFDVGPRDKAQNILNIQPVWPFGLTDDWNLITRTVTRQLSLDRLDL